MTLDHLWLGEIALAIGNTDEAHKRFSLVLEKGAAMQKIAVTLLGLEGLAKTSLRHGEIGTALPILIYIQQHPNTWEFARNRVKALIQELQAELPTTQFATAQARGAALSLKVAVAWGKAIAQDR
jgi:hypothetical protein